MKISGLALFNIALAIVLLACSLWVSTTADYGTSAVPKYCPWADLNDDGKIDIWDVSYVSSKFGAVGEPFVAKAGLNYSGGWEDIRDKAGQYFNITHNLNSTDIIVDIQGKTTIDGGPHQRHLGLTGYTPGWWRTYGGPDDDGVLGESVVQTADGGYALAGYTESFGAGNRDFWLIKTDWTGDSMWNRTYGGASQDTPKVLIKTTDGGYALAGYTESFGAGKNDGWLVKTDAAGNMQWNKTYGGSDEDHPFYAIQTDDGGYMLTGGTRSFGVGGADLWLVKTNSTGDVMWQRTYGGTVDDQAYCIIQTIDRGYVAAGYTMSSGAGMHDFWLVKTNSTGHMEWNKTYGGPNLDSAHSVVQTCDGGYAIAGVTGYFDGIWYRDFWLVKTDSSGNMEWNKTYGGAGDDQAQSLVHTCDEGYAIAGLTNSFGVGNDDLWLVKTDMTGHAQWSRTFGGAGDDRAYSLVKVGDGAYIIAGKTESFGAGDGDFWLIKTDVECGLAWTASTADTITLYRGATDPYWNYVRVRIWKIKETP